MTKHQFSKQNTSLNINQISEQFPNPQSVSNAPGPGEDKCQKVVIKKRPKRRRKKKSSQKVKSAEGQVSNTLKSVFSARQAPSETEIPVVHPRVILPDLFERAGSQRPECGDMNDFDGFDLSDDDKTPLRSRADSYTTADSGVISDTGSDITENGQAGELIRLQRMVQEAGDEAQELTRRLDETLAELERYEGNNDGFYNMEDYIEWSNRCPGYRLDTVVIQRIYSGPWWLIILDRFVDNLPSIVAAASVVNNLINSKSREEAIQAATTGTVVSRVGATARYVRGRVAFTGAAALCSWASRWALRKLLQRFFPRSDKLPVVTYLPSGQPHTLSMATLRRLMENVAAVRVPNFPEVSEARVELVTLDRRPRSRFDKLTDEMAMCDIFMQQVWWREVDGTLKLCFEGPVLIQHFNLMQTYSTYGAETMAGRASAHYHYNYSAMEMTAFLHVTAYSASLTKALTTLSTRRAGQNVSSAIEALDSLNRETALPIGRLAYARFETGLH